VARVTAGPPAAPLAVFVLGCVVGFGQGVADHAGVAVMACVAALAALWLLLETGETD
jgi:hypothetical protein